MKNKNNNHQAATGTELKRTEKSLRSEIKNGNKLLRQEILKVEERVEKLEEGQERIEATVNKISIQLDGFVGTVSNLQTENILGTNKQEDHDLPAIALLRQLQAGKRISKLESRPQSI